MPDERRTPGAPARSASSPRDTVVDRVASSTPESLRTIPLEDGRSIRDELHHAIKDARRPSVVVMSGGAVGARARLSGNASLGRDPTCEVVLPDAGVSWRHARIEDRGDAWVLVDLGSTNGSQVNGVRSAEGRLAHGDRITLGRTILRFEMQDPLDQAYDEHLERLLHIDDLSGLFVRRRFDMELSKSLAAATAHGRSIALLVMDMDGIKAINDRHGHLFGAYTIGETGRVIGSVLGDRGIGSRFGGDEFCALLPDHDQDRAFVLAGEIHAAVNRHEYAREGVTLRPGISIGVAAFPENAPDAEKLFQRADEALYRAKQGGRNRVMR
jgi:two-component system, cell cycle response regulator